MSENVFHVSLRVRDIPTAVEQYKKILGLEPAKQKHDYAKFEIQDPPVVLSLNLDSRGAPGSVAHLGVRYGSTGELMTERVRAKATGLDILDQEGAECCYMRADKFWLTDADGMVWEIYAKGDDIDSHSAADRDMSAAAAPTSACSTNASAQAVSASATAGPAQTAPAKPSSGCGCA